MFTRDHVGVRFDSISHQAMEKDDAEIPLVVMACSINPFTAALAGELHEFVKRTLYTATEAEVNSLLAGCSFALALRSQKVEVRAAPDQGKASFVLPEVKIGNFRASRSKKSTAWTLHFTMTASPASDKQLGQIAETHLKTKYLCFEDSEATLVFEPEETTKARAKKAGPDGAPADAGEAAATH